MPDDGDAVAEGVMEVARPRRMELHCDHPGARFHQRSRDGAFTGTDVEHQVAAADAGGGDEAPCPVSVELVPTPPRRLPGHGAAP